MAKPTTPRIKLTPRFIQSRKPAQEGQRDEYRDSVVPGMRLRISDRGVKSFVLLDRFPTGSKYPVRRTLGHFDPEHRETEPQDDGQPIEHDLLTLNEAREKARHWQRLIARGIDPEIELERQRAKNRLAQAGTFEAVAQAFVDRYVPTIVKQREAKKIVSDFTKRWRNRPIGEIMPQEAADAVRVVAKRGAPYQAYNHFAVGRRLYSWAIGTGEFGLQSSPFDHLSATDVIGHKRESRNRVLSDAEMRAVWSGAGRMGYPYRPLLRLLLASGQRLREVSDMRWSELDFDKKLWVIPAERMKSDNAHAVPLVGAALAILTELDQLRRSPPKFEKDSSSRAPLALWDKGDFVFSSTRGEKPVNGFSKAKARLDALAAEANGSPLPAYVLHDLRRSMRTGLSALPGVTDTVRELVIGHRQTGLKKVYDLFAYASEKQHCLDLWDRRLAAIVEPPPENITTIEQARAKHGGKSGKLS